jgi:cytidylate kinase
MIIAISGLTGSGKNTLGEQLAKSLDFPLICPTFKDLAKKEGDSLMEFQKKAADDSSIDKKFDAVLKKQAVGNCIVTTWLGPWMLDADFCMYVFAPMDIRAARIAKRDNLSLAEAKKHVMMRDEQNRQRYLKVYGIDIYDTTHFDLCVSSALFSKEELHDLVLQAIKIRKLR